MPASIARATARTRVRGASRMIRPPTLPQPKPSAETRRPVLPNVRYSITLPPPATACPALHDIDIAPGAMSGYNDIAYKESRDRPSTSAPDLSILQVEKETMPTEQAPTITRLIPDIQQLITEAGGTAETALLTGLVETVLRSRTLERGDLKVMHRTVRELRYALSVFAPYRSVRKVTVFGSARTLPSAPLY